MQNDNTYSATKNALLAEIHRELINMYNDKGISKTDWQNMVEGCKIEKSIGAILDQYQELLEIHQQ